MLKNKCCLYVIISIRFFSITICNLIIVSPSYKVVTSCARFQVFTAVLMKVQVFRETAWCKPAVQSVTDMQEELAASSFIVHNVLKRRFLGPEDGGSKFLQHPKRQYLYINVHDVTPRQTAILVKSLQGSKVIWQEKKCNCTGTTLSAFITGEKITRNLASAN